MRFVSRAAASARASTGPIRFLDSDKRQQLQV
jgi:hypothetical protein